MKPTRPLLAALLAGLIQTSAFNAHAQDAGTLVINSFGGNWGKAIQLGLVDQFQRETGIRVQLLSTWDVARSKAAIQSGNPPPEDIIDTNFATAYAMHRDGLVAAIDYSVFDPDTLALLPDYAKVPFALGWGQFAIGLCYDKEQFPEGKTPASWADFWDFENYPGRRGMLAWPDEPTPELGLIAAGTPVEELYPLDLDRAFARLDELKAHVPQFPSSPAVLGQMLVDRQVAMQACFTHRVQALIDGGLSRIGIVFDGARLQTEYFYVWENAPNKENAMKFLAFVAEAGPQAVWAQIGNTGPINPRAFELIPGDIARKLPTSPEYDTWPKDDDWYAAQNGDGRTNREVIEARWNAWAAGQ